MRSSIVVLLLMLALISCVPGCGGEATGFTSSPEDIDSIVVEGYTYGSQWQVVATNRSSHITWRVYLADNSIDRGDTLVNGSAVYDSLYKLVNLPTFLGLPAILLQS